MTKYLRSLELSDDGALIESCMSERNSQAVFEDVVDLTSDIQRGCVCQTKVATDSSRSLPPIPRESCH